jgi:hypothetical protein
MVNQGWLPKLFKDDAKLPRMLDCSASIVVYNNPHQMLREAVESFLRCTLKTRLYIIDNSPLPVLENLFSDFALVDYQYYGKNVGYGRAHNWGIEHSKESRYHLIMNPDIIITPGALEHLVDFMDKNQDVGMTCPRMLNEDGSDQYLNRRYPNVLDLFVRRFVPHIFHHLLKRRMDHHEMRDVGYDEICDVEFISGVFMLSRTEVLKTIGGFDPRYFLYFEDIDLSRKVQMYGYRTVYYPNARVIHHWERVSYKDLRMTIIHIVNMCRYFNKWGWRWV